MCGIVGCVGQRRVAPILVEGLRRLEYRGYDSAGLAVIRPEGLSVFREVGRVADLARGLPDELEGSVGMAHTRWATHGGVSRKNAHPHVDATGRIAVVHNGIVENAPEIRSRLERDGIRFRSETDTEVIPHLIRTFYAGDPQQAVRAALQRLQGTYGIAVLFADHPDLLIAARNGSPLVIGLGEGETLLASDSQALVQYTRRVVFLSDGEVAVLSREGVDTTLLDGVRVDPAIQQLDEEWDVPDRGDWAHFMEKEIHEQPESIRRCLRGRVLAREGTAKLGGPDMTPRDLLGVGRVELLACGTSFHAATVGAMAIERLARVPASARIASEFRYRNPIVNRDTIFFAVSQSGETADTLGAVREVQTKGGEVLGIVNVVGSSLARACGRGIYVHSGPELAVASTKAFTSQVTALLLFTLLLARTRTLSGHEGRAVAEALLRIPDQVAAYLEDPGPVEAVADLVQHARYALFMGRGFSHAVALEGALKLKEVAYVPCEAYPAGEMKHGPIAMMEEGTPVVVVVPDDSVREKTLSNVQEVRARGARVVVVHSEGDPEAAAMGDLSIAVPRTLEILSPLLTVLPLQLLAYRTGVRLGRDIDRPRNLAKSVTVE
ncbi:MAG: glutamine--fructose-6-phosphate transaminase (isomerizing) [Deltaproteobacteria bacterium]|nr:glutamine--fructose-6-phosphate transaminase (isomerizing) [Deltaproteobacteria bacterium]